jgi:transposase-like protein
MRKASHGSSPPAPEPEKFERWTAQRKAAIILDVIKGKISVPEAARKYGFTQSEFREWADEYHRAGVDALKVNKKGLEAEYRAEVKRLQAKIGELVMENEIRKEAMRPFTSVEPMFPGSLLDEDGQKP